MLDPRVRERAHDTMSKGALNVPALGEAVTQLLIETRRPDADTRKIAEIIRRDPALAGNLLGFANATAYAGREPAVTLQQVVSRLGTLALRDLALAIAMKSRAFQVPGHEAEMRARFVHAFATALFAQEIARTRRLGVEEAFLAGLFHSVGRPIVLQLLVDVCKELGASAERDELSSATTEMYADAGARAVETWQLGGRLAVAVRHHQDFCPDSPEHRGAALAGFAAAVAEAALSPSESTETRVREHAALPLLGLYPDDVDRLLSTRDRVLAQMAGVA